MRGTSPLKPQSNWHRMLKMLNLNGGTLYRAQMYQSKKYMTSSSGHTFQIDNHPYIHTGGMPKMTCVSAMAPLDYAYEHRAEAFGLVVIRYHKNRKWIILLPKGYTVLREYLDQGRDWVPSLCTLQDTLGPNR